MVEIKNGKGEVYSQRIDFPRGHPLNPMTDGELAAKFKDCARHGARPLKEKDLDEIINLVYDLERLDDLSQVVQLLNGARRKA